MEMKSKLGVGFASGIWREAFQIVTTTLLSLLLPLSFLLLSRLSTVHYLLSILRNPESALGPDHLLSFLFLYVNSTVLYSLLSFLSIAALLHLLTGKITFFFSKSSQPGLYTTWVLLCAFQVCVGLGIEGTIAAGIEGSVFSRETGLVSRVLFFLGLHETMRFWSTSVVKPVVDDTVMGFVKEERWVEKVAMAVSCGSLWWWRLRDEIDSLVVVVELKRELAAEDGGGVGVVDFIGWWLYYLTVLIGSVRILKGVFSVGMVTLFKKVEAGGVLDKTEEEIDQKV